MALFMMGGLCLVGIGVRKDNESYPLYQQNPCFYKHKKTIHHATKTSFGSLFW